MKKYFSLIKFSHSVFALPFAIIGFLLALPFAHTPFELNKFLLVLACMVFARSAAMAFNRYTDWRIDARNPRTKTREIPAGLISPTSALIFTIISSVCFAVCTYFINPLCFVLSPVALLVILGYSFTKRFTALCHFILGLGLSLAPLGAFLAVTGRFAWVPVLFSFSVLTWVSGFDIIYALSDEAFDKEAGLHSVPAWLGRVKAIRLSEFLHLLSVAGIVVAGFMVHLGIFYWVGTTFYACMLIYQHRVVDARDLSRLNLAFFTLNGLASVVFACFFIIDHFLKLSL